MPPTHPLPPATQERDCFSRHPSAIKQKCTSTKGWTRGRGAHMKLGNFAAYHQQTHQSSVVPFTHKKTRRENNKTYQVSSIYPLPSPALCTAKPAWSLQGSSHVPAHPSLPSIPSTQTQRDAPRYLEDRVPPKANYPYCKIIQIQAGAQGGRHLRAPSNQARVRLTGRQGLGSIHPFGPYLPSVSSGS